PLGIGASAPQMLHELRIRNFAIIEEAHLEFGAGLNVLSGETGAGKTIILSALGLLLGSRASPDMIRAGEKEAVVEGLFELEGEAALPELAARKSDGGRRELLVRRVIAEGGGRSRVTIDGELATVQSLGKIGASLVQVYGQHEQHSLLRAESHRETLDRYANLDDELASYRERYARAQDIQSRLLELNRRERERADLLELARFRATELERAGLVTGEDEALSRARNRAGARRRRRRGDGYGFASRGATGRCGGARSETRRCARDDQVGPREPRRSGAHARRIRVQDRGGSRASGGNRQPTSGTDAAKAQIRRVNR